MPGRKGPVKGVELFPKETAKIASLLNLRRKAIALTCVMLGLGIENAQMAALRGVSVKTVEAEISQARPLLQGALRLDFTPRPNQLVLICHDLLEGRWPQATHLNGQRPEQLQTGLLTMLCCLTPREAEVCALRALIYGNTEIAQMLNISVKTVEAHKNNSKLKIRAALKLEQTPRSRQFSIILHDMVAKRLPKGMTLREEGDQLRFFSA